MSSVQSIISPLHLADLTEQTYLLLKESILRRELQPGEKILVDDLARRLGVSRTPVMDALKRLSSDGLVEIVPRRGTFVTQLNAKDVAELFDIRIMIELYAVDAVMSSGKSRHFLRAIQEPLRRMEESIENDDYSNYEVFIANDRIMHLELVRGTENERLIQIYTDMNVHIQVARAHYLKHVENARQAHEEHLAILQAFRDGDPQRARDSLREHITNVAVRIQEVLQERGGKL